MFSTKNILTCFRIFFPRHDWIPFMNTHSTIKLEQMLIFDSSEESDHERTNLK